MVKTVFVSGCYDLLHSGHVEFFREASSYGDLYVAIGSDKTVNELKNKYPINTEQERLFMVQAIRYVKHAFISKGSGMMDFVEELHQIHPNYFVVNKEGDRPEKRSLCQTLGIEYIVLERKPHTGLPPRSSTELRKAHEL